MKSPGFAPRAFFLVKWNQKEGNMKDEKKTKDQKEAKSPEPQERTQEDKDGKKGIDDNTRTRSDKMIGGTGKSVENKSA